MLYKRIKSAEFISVVQDTELTKWEEIRTSGIGGSDVGGIIGVNPYSSKLAVFLAKKGFASGIGNNSTKWGHILEDPIRQETAKELGITIETVPGTFRSIEFPFMLANLDGLVFTDKELTINGDTVKGLGGHEIKTSAQGDGWGDDEVPDSYFWQVQHYMSVTGLDWFILTCFILSTKTVRHYIIHKEEKLIQQMIEDEKEFWEKNVLANNPPEPEGKDNEVAFVKNLPVQKMIELPNEMNEIIEEREEIINKIKDLTKRKKILTEKIILAFSTKDFGVISEEKSLANTNQYQLTYNTVKKDCIDTEMLKKRGLFDEFKKTTEYRKLTVKKI